MAVAAGLAVAAAAYHWLSRPRSLETITADYYVRSATLAAELEGADGARAVEIVKKLATFGSLAKPAVPSILDYLDRLESRGDSDARRNRAEALRQAPRIGDARFIPMYLRMLQDKETTVSQRMGTWTRLSEMGAVEVIEPMLRDVYTLYGDDVSVTALLALQRVGRHHPSAIFDAFVHPDRAVRHSAVCVSSGLSLPETAARGLLDEVFAALKKNDHEAKAELESLASQLARRWGDDRVDEAMRYRASRFEYRAHREWAARFRGEAYDETTDPRPTWEEEQVLRDRIRAAAIAARDDVSGIRGFLYSDNIALRTRAVNVLAEHGDRDVAIREIRQLLNEDDVYFVMNCMEALGALTAVEAVDDLIRLAELPQSPHRLCAIMALTKIGDPRAFPLFMNNISKRRYAAEAAKGLVAVAQPKHREELENLVSNHSKIEPTAKLCILVYLDGQDGRSYRRELVDLVQSVSKEEWLRFSAGLDPLSEAPKGDERLLDYLRSRNDRLASLAVRPLIARMGDDAIAHLRSVIPSAGEDTTWEIIKALGWMDSPEAADALIYVMERGNERYKPDYQLYEITGEKYGEIAEAWRAWYREQRSSP